MRIVHVTGMVHHKLGSMERHFIHLAGAARARGHELVVVTDVRGPAGGFLEQLRAAGAEVVLVPFRSLGPRSLGGTLWKLLGRQPADVVHAHFTPAAHVALSVAALRRVPLRVRSLHSLPDFEHRAPPRTFALGLLSSAAAHRSIAVSGAVRDAYAELSVPGHTFHVADLGVDLEAYRRRAGTRERVRAELGLQDGDVVAGTVSRAEPVKDLDTLLRAAMRAFRLDARLRLVVVGGGSLEAGLRAQAEAAGIGDRLRWLGFRSDVPDLLAAMDLFVLPSWREGFGLGLVEAGASGLPLVGSRIGGIAEIIRDGDTGLLFPRGDDRALAERILRLAADPALRARLGQAALAEVGRFAVQRRATELLGWYESWSVPAPALRHVAARVLGARTDTFTA